MEADTMCDFVAKFDDELSFSKGIVIKVLCLVSCMGDVGWHKAEYSGKEGFVPCNYVSLKPHDWFMHGMSWLGAENLLLGRDENGIPRQPDGAFIVRNSQSEPCSFILSVKYGDFVQHYRVLRDGAGKYFLWVVKFDSLNQLIRYHRTSSVSRSQQLFLKDSIQAVKVNTFKQAAPTCYPDHVSIPLGVALHYLLRL